MDSIADAATAAAEDLHEHHQEGLSRYVSEIADSVSSIAGSLRHKSVDELVHEVGAIARKNPTLFLAGSVAVGLGIGRFARSSAKHQREGASFSEGVPRAGSVAAYPERAEYDDIQHVTEEDYLADDFALAGGEDIDLEMGDIGDSDRRFDTERKSNSEELSARTRSGRSGNNSTIGGDFYE